MKKEYLYQIFYCISFILMMLFIIVSIYQYVKFNIIANSAPPEIVIFVNVFIYVIPSVLFAIIGEVLKNKFSKKDKEDK